ncbi:MAG: hypothetical protein R3B13_20100 [Polyangiaceae bacterium]
MRSLLTLLLALSAAACTTEFDEGLLDGKAGCSGCFDGVRCLSGNDASACGRQGESCTTCTAPASTCEQGSCVVDAAVVALAVGSTHVFAVDRQARLWGWGSNSASALAVDSATESSEIPLRIGAVENWREVAAGGNYPELFGCAIDDSSRLWCWGENGNAQLGLGHTNVQIEPALVGQKSWTDIDGGSAHACALDDAGALFCWGYGDQGRLGVPNTSTQQPLQVLQQDGFSGLTVGDVHGCMIASDDSLWCFGENESGQVGHEGGVEPAVVGTSYEQVSAGRSHSCGIRLDGSLYCWGDNSSGQLGVSASSPNTPIQVGSDTDWKHVSCGRAHSCALKKDGSLWCWGSAADGQIGVRFLPDPAPLTQVGSEREWVLVDTSDRTTCAVARDGSAWCWGDNGNRQAGIFGASPVEEPNLVEFP